MAGMYDDAIAEAAQKRYENLQKRKAEANPIKASTGERIQGGLGGATAGAGAGAKVGSAFGPYGTIVGAILGGVVGGVGGAMSAKPGGGQSQSQETGNNLSKLAEMYKKRKELEGSGSYNAEFSDSGSTTLGGM